MSHEIVISAGDMGRFVMISALPAAAQCQTYQAPRQALLPDLPRSERAPRYAISDTTA